jgi:hypothetical protein
MSESAQPTSAAVSSLSKAEILEKIKENNRKIMDLNRQNLRLYKLL